MLYFLVMTLEESNYGLISGFDTLLSAARLGILLVCMILIVLENEKNELTAKIDEHQKEVSSQLQSTSSQSSTSSSKSVSTSASSNTNSNTNSENGLGRRI